MLAQRGQQQQQPSILQRASQNRPKPGGGAAETVTLDDDDDVAEVVDRWAQKLHIQKTQSNLKSSQIWCKKFDFPKGRIIGEMLLSSIPPWNSVISDKEELFELTQCPSRAKTSARTLHPELQRYNDIVCCPETLSQPGLWVKVYHFYYCILVLNLFLLLQSNTLYI